MYKIRPFNYRDTDYERLAEIDALVFPKHAFSPDELKHSDLTRDTSYPFRRDVIEYDGEIIAFGEYGQHRASYHLDKYFFTIMVHPEREQPQLRETYLNHVIETLKNRNPVALTAGMLANNPAYEQFFKENGFRVTGREQSSRLELAAFDAQSFQGKVEKVEQQGIQIKTVAQLMQTDPDWKRHLYELIDTVEQDVPGEDIIRSRSFEHFEERILNHPGMIPEAWFVALDGEQYVGASNLFRMEAQPDTLYNGLTGVLRSYRRRGIAMALKLRGIEYARANGFVAVESGSEEDMAMHQLNLRLGFQPQPGWVEYEKPLSAPSPIAAF